MSSIEKPEEVIARIIRKISDNPVGVRLSAEVDQKNLSVLRRRFREVVDKFYRAEIFYDEKDYHWKSLRPKFLEGMLLPPEEAVILAGFRRNAYHYGYSLKDTVHSIVNSYSKRRHLKLLQKDFIERSDEKMMDMFARIKSAERQGLYLRILYRDAWRTVIPLQIVNLEYYWYLIAEEQNGEWGIHPFAIARIDAAVILDSPYDRRRKRRLMHKIKGVENGMNAFYKPYERPGHAVEVLVVAWFETYLQRSPYFALWVPTHENIKINDEVYCVYTVTSCDEKFRDIIPTIQKYMPYVVVRDVPGNQGVIDALREASETYAALFEKSGEKVKKVNKH